MLENRIPPEQSHILIQNIFRVPGSEPRAPISKSNLMVVVSSDPITRISVSSLRHSKRLSSSMGVTRATGRRCATIVGRSGVVALAEFGVADFPFLAEATDGFAQEDGECGDGFEALQAAGGQAAVVAAADFGEQQFGVAENAGERIIQFVAQNFAEVVSRSCQWPAGVVHKILRPCRARFDRLWRALQGTV